jgi:hypothetical protein
VADLFSYRIHGLNIQSPQPLKKEQDSFLTSDILIQWIAKPLPLPEPTQTHILKNRGNEPQAILYKHPNGDLSMDYFDCGLFYLQNSVLSVLQQHSDSDFFRAVLTTQILPLVSSLFRVTLHGGVVVQEGRAAIYLGQEGVGKSTLTTYLLQNAFSIYSDDVAAVDFDTSLKVYPGLPEVRINRDSCQNLLSEEQREALPVKLAKQQLLFSQAESTVASVAAVFILSPQQNSIAPQKTALSSSQSFSCLIENQFRWDIWNPKTITNEFQVIANMCRQVPFWKLDYPLDYKSLPWIAQHIEGSLCVQPQNSAHFW